MAAIIKPGPDRHPDQPGNPGIPDVGELAGFSDQMSDIVYLNEEEAPMEQAGGYQDWYNNEDYFLWIRMYLSGCKFGNIDDTLVFSRVTNDFYKRRGGWKYFRSEANIQILMYKERIIGLFRLFLNISIRFIIQVLLPNSFRGFIFRKLFREKIKVK